MRIKKSARHLHELVCEFCSTEFFGYRASGRFCSNQCRHATSHRNLTERQKRRRSENHKKWSTLNWLKRRDYNLFRTYGITNEQYAELLAKQNHCCAICQKHETEFSQKLAVDHDHSTGEIFGLLCNNCNRRVIGEIREKNLFLKAYEYLQKGTGWFVPVKIKSRKKRRCKKKIKKRLKV